MAMGASPFVNFNLDFSKELVQGFDARLGIGGGLSNCFKRKYSDSDYAYEMQIKRFPVSVSLTLSYTFGKRQLREVYSNAHELNNSRF